VLFHIGERLVLKNGFKMKKPAIFVLNAVIEFSGAVKCNQCKVSLDLD